MAEGKALKEYFAPAQEMSDEELEFESIEFGSTPEMRKRQAAARAVLRKRANDDANAILDKQLCISKRAVWATWAGAVATLIAAVVSYFSR